MTDSEQAAGATRPAAIFWDMDGTLTNSEPLWEQATFHLSETLGRRLTPTERLATVGATFEDTLTICADKAGVVLQPGDTEKYRRLMFDYVKSLFAEYLEIFPGIPELLGELKELGVPMMVTTNTERYVADSAIAALGRHYFVDTVCGDEVPHGKPAPDMYAEAARRVGARPQDCLVFEDSAAGMRAAVAAGCSVIGLPEGEHVTVPDKVTVIAELRGSGHRHLEGATARDIYEWYQRLRSL
ncbi:HAD family phosphatase [Corynebacterium aurimucosum]|uniref:HAD family phosphatase n=1 Tax=Corynebacterium aurimucosum TaxID=169292 RepID=A0A558IXU9_9CORY|nr:HAD family phosphatase [Corynebacterium aurimucosum]TVU86206.1 HAD family phosphatase [Corynebacterium aurimucosum]